MSVVEVPSYEDRKQLFEKVKTRILSILDDWERGKLRNRLHYTQQQYDGKFPHRNGLTAAEIGYIYANVFQHLAEIDNRLRELRHDSEVVSEAENGRLVWRLNPAKWRQKP